MTERTVLLPLTDAARPDEAPVGLEHLATEETGVAEVSINPVSGMVHVRYDDARIDLDSVRDLLARHGFPTGQSIAREETS